MIHALTRCALALLLLFLTTTADAQATPGGNWRADIRDYAQQLIDAGLVPGLSVAVVAGDRVIDGFGIGIADIDSGRPVDEGTRFYIASTTKALTATAVALLAAEGRIALDAPVTRYLPDLTFGEGVNADEVTIHDLLAMTDGIDDEWPVIFRTAYSGEFTPEQLIALLADYPASENGRSYEYSNLPYNLLGLVLDVVDDGQLESGGWKAVVKASVLDPLDMDEVTALPSNVEADRIALPHILDGGGRFMRTRLAKADANLHAAGGHFASARSLARFVAMHLGGGTLEGHRVFDADAIASTQHEQTTQQTTYLAYQRDGWGYGWDRATWRDERILQRFGGFRGYFSHMSFLPEHNLGVVVLTNGSTPTPAEDLLARLIYDRLMEREDIDTRFTEVLTEAVAERDHHAGRIAADLDNRASRLAPLPQALEAYSGSFHNDAMGTMHWQTIAGGLEVTMGIAHARAEIFDADNNLLRITLSGGGTVAGFEFDETGNASRVRWNGFDFLSVVATSD